MEPVRSLPEDMIANILKRLPVKSLARFQLVSKHWLALLTSSAFAISHMRHTLGTQQSVQTLICLAPGMDSTTSLLLQDVENPPVVSDLMLPYRLDKYMDKVSSHCVVGSANGIACVAVTIYDNKYKVVPRETDIYFWNPLTRQSKFIRCFKNKNISAAGFGYDSVTGDYKVLVFGGGEADDSHFEVYSHNNRTWSNVPHPFLSIPLNFQVCFRGYLLDIYRDTRNAIAVFNLHSDVLIFPIELPVLDQGDPHTRDVLNSAVELPSLNPVPGPSFLHDLDFHITEFQNSCALIMHEGQLQKIILWTLDDDSCFLLADIEAKWTPLFSVHLGMPAVVYSGFFGNGRLQVAARRIGTDEFWISCDVDKKEAKLRLVDFDGLASRVCMHVDSLVSLDGFSRVDD